MVVVVQLVALAVAHFLKDRQMNVRRWAVVALGKTGDVGYSDLMIDALSDSHHSVRFAAAGALEALGSAAAGALLARRGQVTIGRPGGDRIGRRRLDTHFLALQTLGAAVEVMRAVKRALDPGDIMNPGKMLRL